MSTLAAASVSALLSVSAFAAGTAGSDMIPVVVTLKGLGTGPAWAERIAHARERVKRALQGHHVVITREYDLIPALALSVDDRALRILRAHPDVESVAEDGTSAPGSGAGARSAN